MTPQQLGKLTKIGNSLVNLAEEVGSITDSNFLEKIIATIDKKVAEEKN